MNLPRATEIARLQRDMVLAFERGEEPDVRDFNARFEILSEEFLKAIREPGRRDGETQKEEMSDSQPGHCSIPGRNGEGGGDPPGATSVPTDFYG